jgi:hypothetical protein
VAASALISEVTQKVAMFDQVLSGFTDVDHRIRVWNTCARVYNLCKYVWISIFNNNKSILKVIC